jgi:hypothetical protein
MTHAQDADLMTLQILYCQTILRSGYPEYEPRSSKFPVRQTPYNAHNRPSFFLLYPSLPPIRKHPSSSCGLSTLPPLNLRLQLHKILLRSLKLQPLLDPLVRLIQPAHLEQTLAPPPPALRITDLLHLDARLGINSTLSPVPLRHVRLRAVAQQARDLLAHQTGRLPVWPAERQVDGERVELDGGAGLAFAELVVARVAQLADLRGALGVDGDRGRRCTRGCLNEEDVSVDGVERFELCVERVVHGPRCGDILCLGVEGEREERECVEGIHGWREMATSGEIWRERLCVSRYATQDLG